jgi:hypothetical protein
MHKLVEGVCSQLYYDKIGALAGSYYYLNIRVSYDRT